MTKMKCFRIARPGYWAEVFLFAGEPRGEVVLHRTGKTDALVTQPIGIYEIAIFYTRKLHLIDAFMAQLISQVPH